MNLNLGSSNPKGKYKDPIWVNFDYCKMDGVQVRGSAVELPFRDNSFDLIESVHCAEHLSRDKTLHMLAECLRTLKPGSKLMLEVPDFEQVVYLLADAYKRKDSAAIHIWKTSCFGKSERKYMSHLTGFDETQLHSYLNQVGFTSVKRLVFEEDMISRHYLQEPILLFEAYKGV